MNAPRAVVYRAILDARAVAARMVPDGLSTADNETGWRMSLAKLAALVEAERKPTIAD
jgi:hypothetical protein